MFTVKIVNIITKKEFLVEANQCSVEKDTAVSFDDWEQDVFKQECGKLVITAPAKDATNILYHRIVITNEDGISCVYFASDSNIFVMNEQGQTVAIYRK